MIVLARDDTKRVFFDKNVGCSGDTVVGAVLDCRKYMWNENQYKEKYEV